MKRRPTKRQRGPESAAVGALPASPTPVRADLAAVSPKFYAVIERAWYPNVEAMCAANGFPLEEVPKLMQSAAIDQSDLTLLPALLDEAPVEWRPVCPAVFMRDGRIALFYAVLGRMTDRREEAEAFARSIVAEADANIDGVPPEWFVCDFRANRERPAS
jgi:hypothetical protein